MGKVITFGNFKGGTGKTTNAALLAKALSDMGYKILFIDKDPQANATTLFYRTQEQLLEIKKSNKVRNLEKDYLSKRAKIHSHDDTYMSEEDKILNKEFELAMQVINEEYDLNLKKLEGQREKTKYLFDGIKIGAINDCIIPVTDNLCLIPTTPTFSYYPKEMQKMFKKESEQIAYFNQLLERVKDNYDFVFIDVPPTISLFTDSAIFASDFAMIIMQTQETSLQGAEVFVDYMQHMLDTYNIDVDVLGILPVIMKKNAAIDEATLTNAISIFGEENIFETHIKQMERVKRYFITGITKDDYHDTKVLEVYTELANEFLTRIKQEVTA